MSTSHTPGDALVLHASDVRGVHLLTLNQPKAFNVLSEAMLTELQHRLDRIAADPSARVLVIAAEGKAFCAGHDLKQMKANPRLDYYQQLFGQCSRMMVSLLKLPVPVIARVQGVAAAAGCQLVAQCDLAVAAEGVRFGVNGIDVGLFCGTPSVPLVRNMQPKQAMEMLLTGDFVDAAEAKARGLVNRIAPADELDAAVEALVARIVGKPRVAIAIGKQQFYRQMEAGIEQAYDIASEAMACNMMEPEALEGVLAFVEKRKPR